MVHCRRGVSRQRDKVVVGSSCELLEFPLTADGNVAPTLNIQGNLTQLSSAVVPFDDNSFTFAVDFDSLGRQYACGFKIVAGGIGIQYFFTVYEVAATGNVPPLRYVHGSNTNLDPPSFFEVGSGGICLDASDNTYVGLGAKIISFPAGADGNAVGTLFKDFGFDPIASQISSLRYDPARNWVWVSVLGLDADLGIYAFDLAAVQQRKITDHANFVAPWQMTLGPDLLIYVADFPSDAAVLIYAADADGESTPIRTLTVTDGIEGVAVDSNSRIYAAAGQHLPTFTSRVFIYAAGASGTDAPIQTITGPPGGGSLTNFDHMTATSGASTNIQSLAIYPRAFGPPTMNPRPSTTPTAPTFDPLILPGDVNKPAVFEPNSALTGGIPQLFIAASGGANWGGCIVNVSFDNVTYSAIGSITNPAPQGVLTATLASHADPDTVDTLSVDLAASTVVLQPDATHADADAFRTLALITPTYTTAIPSSGEILSYGAVAAGGGGSFSVDLTYLRRGVYGTAPASHASGALFTRADLNRTSPPGNTLLIFDLPAQYIGTTIHLKFVSFNRFGNSPQDISTVTAYTYVPTGAGYGGDTGGLPHMPTGLMGASAGP